MTKRPCATICFHILNTAAVIVVVAIAGRAESPTPAENCRSPWGADDQRGAINRLTPAKTLEAASLIKQGKIYQLGRVYEAGMPLYGSRSYNLVIPNMRGPLG